MIQIKITISLQQGVALLKKEKNFRYATSPKGKVTTKTIKIKNLLDQFF